MIFFKLKKRTTYILYIILKLIDKIACNHHKKVRYLYYFIVSSANARISIMYNNMLSPHCGHL